MKVACIDLEGVLIPEIWPFIAQKTGISALSITTREEPDYRKLMGLRIDSLKTHGIRLAQLQSLAAQLDPFPDATHFLNQTRKRYNVLIVSDCFHELADGLLAKLGAPAAFCHRLLTDSDGFISQCAFSGRNGKEAVIAELQASGSEVMAVGDAFNDISMLQRAHHGFLVRPSAQTKKAAPELPVVEHLHEICQIMAL